MSHGTYILICPLELLSTKISVKVKFKMTFFTSVIGISIYSPWIYMMGSTEGLFLSVQPFFLRSLFLFMLLCLCSVCTSVCESISVEVAWVGGESKLRIQLITGFVNYHIFLKYFIGCLENVCRMQSQIDKKHQKCKIRNQSKKKIQRYPCNHMSKNVG